MSISISLYFFNIISISYRNRKSDIEALLTPANFFVELERDFDEFVYSGSEIARLANARQKIAGMLKCYAER